MSRLNCPACKASIVASDVYTAGTTCPACKEDTLQAPPADTSKPPNDAARIALFLNLVEHDKRLREAFPYSEEDQKVFVNFAAQDLQPALELRLMLLRKYVVKSENLYLESVLKAFKRETSALPPTLAEGITAKRTKFADINAGKIDMKIADKDDTIHRDYFFNAVYGALMHADWGRWQETRKNRHFVRTISLMTLQGDYWNLILETQATILNTIKAGHLTDPRTH